MDSRLHHLLHQKRESLSVERCRLNLNRLLHERGLLGVCRDQLRALVRILRRNVPADGSRLVEDEAIVVLHNT